MPYRGRRILDRPRPEQEVPADSNAALLRSLTADRDKQPMINPHDPRGWTALEGAAADGHGAADGRHRASCEDVYEQCVRCRPGRGHYFKEATS